MSLEKSTFTVTDIYVKNHTLKIDCSNGELGSFYLKKEKEWFAISIESVWQTFLDLKVGNYQIYTSNQETIKYGLGKRWARVILDKNNGIKITKDSEDNIWIKKEKYTSKNRHLVFKTNITNMMVRDHQLIIEGISNIPTNSSTPLSERVFYFTFHKYPSKKKKLVPLTAISKEGAWHVVIPLSEMDKLDAGRFQIGIFEEITGHLFGSFSYYKNFTEKVINSKLNKIHFVTNSSGRLICKASCHERLIGNYELKQLNRNNISIRIKELFPKNGQFVLVNSGFEMKLDAKRSDNKYTEIVLRFHQIKRYFYQVNSNAKFELIFKQKEKLEKIKFKPNNQNALKLIDNRILVYISSQAKDLQIRYKKVNILRNIRKIQFKNNKLIIKGNVIGRNIDIRRVPIYLVINNRDNERKSYFTPLEVKKGPLFAIPYLRESREHLYNSFDLEIDLSELQAMLGIGIWDFYITIGKRKLGYSSKKLGYAFYNYKKDLILEDYQQNHTYYRASITPRGNLKIQLLQQNDLQTDLLQDQKSIWLIGERPDTAQENGLLFFRYIFQHKPEITPYYAINADSPDLSNFTAEERKNVVIIGSSEHFAVSKQAAAFIGTHDVEYFVPFVVDKERADVKRVFLQHGVMGRKRAEYHKYYYKRPFNMVVVSSEAEKELFVKEFKYHPKEIAVTGLSRFDSLYNQITAKGEPKRKYILVMPTWREWINLSQPFMHSEYYHRYRSLLTNSVLKKCLRENNIKLLFYPHYRMQPYIEYFQELADDTVEIVELGKVKVQDLLIEAMMMVTDYSSVSFDMNFMGKPVVFYHFDTDRFFKDGILRPINETFIGDIFSQESEVIEAIQYYINVHFQEKEEVIEDKKQIIKYIDNNNNERIYQAIQSSKSYKNLVWIVENYKRKSLVYVKYFVKYTPLFYLYSGFKKLWKR